MNIWWYVWCWQHRRFRRSFKTLTNICQEDIDVLNIKGCHPKSCIMYYFPIISTCARSFLTNKDESFDNNLTCQPSEIIKANNVVKNFSPRVWSPIQRIFNALFFASTLITTTEKKEQAFCFGSCIPGDKWHTEEKRRTHQETFMRKKGKPGGKNCVRRWCLFEDRSSCNSKRHL